MKVLIYFLASLVVAFANRITILNNCSITVWPGILGNPGKGQPEGGGFPLDSSASKDVDVDSSWAGRIWGRTGCDDSGHCQTGDCGNQIECNGVGGAPPVSLAEITLNGKDGEDFYYVSFLDGYNLPIKIQPTEGFEEGNDDCAAAGCTSDLNSMCPDDLKVDDDNGTTIACQSACMKFDTDQYCCRGDYGTPETCMTSDWPANYPATFKQACPDAYSYVFDDSNSTFTCEGNGAINYQVIFCP